MSPKAPLNFVGAGAGKRLEELERLAEARGNAVAGMPLAPAPAPAEPAISPETDAERELASSQARKPAASRARRSGSTTGTSRSGTQAAPHVRADGQATRSTTIHLPVDLHQKLRLEAARRGGHMSAIVAEAVREWFSKR